LYTSLQNTKTDAVSALRRQQKRKSEDSSRQNVMSDGTRKGCVVDGVPNESFAHIPWALDHAWKSISQKQSTHAQQGPLIRFPNGPMDSSFGNTLDCDSGNCYQSQGQYNNSTTPTIESLDDSLYLLRPIEEICLFGAAELDESIASLLSTILSHPETNA
jgi:hypothetical protein